jgi:hypothetical protein
MFDLEKSIADWRKQMLAAGIKTPVPLEELEIHLREEIERQMKTGLSEQEAFEISIQRIGQPKMLNNEFKKSKRTFMKRTVIIPAGIFLLAREKHNEVLMAAGIIITLIGISMAIYGFKKRKA